MKIKLKFFGTEIDESAVALLIERALKSFKLETIEGGRMSTNDTEWIFEIEVNATAQVKLPHYGKDKE